MEKELKPLTDAGLSAQLVQLIDNAPVIASEIESAGQYLAQFKGLKIVDAETYRAAKAYASEIRMRRLSIDKELTGAAAALKTLVKGYERQTGELLAMYKATESEIRDEIKRVDDEKKAAAEAEEREKARVFMEKTNQLFEAGFAFDGWQYKVGLIVLTPENIAGMSDDELADYVRKGQAETARIAGIMRKAQEAETARTEKQAAQSEQPATEKQEFADRPTKLANNVSDWFASPISEDFLAIAQPEPEQEVVKNYVPPGFSAGFDACKNKIIALLSDENRKFTRAQLIDEIKKMNYGN